MQWSHRSAVASVAVALGVAGMLGACSSSGGTTGVPGSTDLPPASGPPASAPATGSTPAAAPSSRAPSPSRTVRAEATRTALTYVFPVVGHNSYAHSHHDYPATDIITACGNRVVAVTSGRILDVTRVDRWKPSVNAGATRGGLSVSLLGDDGVRYYGSHLSSIEPSVRRGARVRAGQTLARTGDTGDASACHLHFGISPPCAGVGDWWTQRGAVYPWPYLDAWRTGRAKSPVAEVRAWHAEHGCPRKPLTDP